MALRERRMRVTGEDFRKSKENVLYRKTETTPQGAFPLCLCVCVCVCVLIEPSLSSAHSC